MPLEPVTRLVAAAVLMLALAACADDDRRAGGSASTAGATRTTETSEATPTAPETPSVVPATGEELSVESVSMRLTDSPKWGITATSLTVVAGLSGPHGILDVVVQDVPAGLGRTTESKAVGWEEVSANQVPAPKRVANRTIDGVDCFVLDGRNDKLHRYVVGAVVNGRLFVLTFVVPTGIPDGDQLIEQMLASVDIKD
ncbi:hypothetical protein FHP29_16485 [Nocardioides albidus]|uniref:DUF5642 domain-containing protein n=1 Tax=Nocardioides albidus TaxID=1517589 RepID=A0A5C4VNL1_9ACTN|nr:hypothetical protein [Nocardioides albidus]TNM37427.1 hypothetical protein FHP29_16485 [Nocardioides albidus]